LDPKNEVRNAKPIYLKIGLEFGKRESEEEKIVRCRVW